MIRNLIKKWLGQGQEQQWKTVDGCFNTALSGNYPKELHQALQQTLQTAKLHAFPEHQVSPQQGAMLNILAQTCGAKRILEVGTLAGYSTLWLAEALESNGGGDIISLELDENRARIANANIKLLPTPKTTVHIETGSALDSLPKLHADGFKTDMTFIDADKVNNVQYVEWALKMSNPGALIVIDNVVRSETGVNQPNAVNKYPVSNYLSQPRFPKLRPCAIQTVGEKGWDGFILLRVDNKY